MCVQGQKETLHQKKNLLLGEGKTHIYGKWGGEENKDNSKYKNNFEREITKRHGENKEAREQREKNSKRRDKVPK